MNTSHAAIENSSKRYFMLPLRSLKFQVALTDIKITDNHEMKIENDIAVQKFGDFQLQMTNTLTFCKFNV